MLGTCSSLLAAQPIRTESGDCIQAALVQTLPRSSLPLVRSVRTDDPSRSLVTALKAVLPELQVVALDPVHIAMRYEAAFAGKRSPGSKTLRYILRRFSRPATDSSATQWGNVFAGDATRLRVCPISASHSRMILDGSTPHSVGSETLASLDMHSPWTFPGEFVRAMACLSALYPAEMQRSLPRSATPLARVLYNATEASTVQWLFNNSRARALVSLALLPLMPIGTTANEALHAELNGWFRNQPRSYSTTLELQVNVARLGKSLAHTSALYRPALRQTTAADTLAREVATLSFDPADWRRWCDALRSPGCGFRRESLPLSSIRKSIARRLAVVALIKRQAAEDGSAGTLDRSRGWHRAARRHNNDRIIVGAATLPYIRKRTAFTQARVGSLKLRRMA